MYSACNFKSTPRYSIWRKIGKSITYRLREKILFRISSTETFHSLLVSYVKGNGLGNKKRHASILESLAPKHRPSQALNLLQIKGSIHKRIRVSEFQSLCSMSRTGIKKDAKIIVTALKDFKRCNSFYVTEKCCKLAFEGMLRSLTPHVGTFSDSNKVYASLWLGNAFLDAKTGLYYATDRIVLEEFVLETLLDGISSLKKIKSLSEIIVDDKFYEFVELNKKNHGKKQEAIDLEERRKLLTKEAVLLTVNIIDKLLYRVSNPTLQMKKRAARAYMNRIKLRHGPSPTTVHMAVEICLVAENIGGVYSGGSKAARYIVDTFEAMWFSGNSVWDETKQMIKDVDLIKID